MMREFINSLLSNYALLAALLSLAVAQLIKIFYYWSRDGEFDVGHFFEAAGMPSAHSAMACALSLTVGLREGWISPIFAVAVIFSIVVMYDAMGVRRAAGKQALVLNKIIEEVYTKGKISDERLHELLGHSPLEVLMGAILGILVALVVHLLL